MALNLTDEILAVERTVWQYDLTKTTVEEIIEYFGDNYGIAMSTVNLTGQSVSAEQLCFRSASGSTSHYMSTGDYLLINQQTLEYEVVSEAEYEERKFLTEKVSA